MHELYFQRSSTQTMTRTDYLFAIDNIEVLKDKSSIKRFETVFRKRPKPATMTEDESDEFLSRVNSDFDDDDSVDTDSKPSPYRTHVQLSL